MRLPALLLLAASLGFAQSAVPTPAQSAKPKITALYHVGFWVRDIAKSRAFYEAFLGFEEPYVLNRESGQLQMVVIKVNEGQSIFLFPDPSKILPSGDNLDHLGLVTDNAAALHDLLESRGVKVSAVHAAHVGDLIFGIKDPDGHPYEVTQFMPDGQLMKHQGRNLPATRISARLRSATITSANPAASAAYYCGKLGFREISRISSADGAPVQIELAVPDGTSGVILKHAAANPEGRAPWAVVETCLEVPSVAKAVEVLTARAAAQGFAPPGPVEAGPHGERRVSCIDPDGERIVLMEPPAAR